MRLGSSNRTGAQQGYLKCSIEGTNNQLWNVFQRFFQLQLFCFPKRYIFCRQKRTIFMDAHPYFWLLNSTGKMMACSRHNQIKFWGILCTLLKYTEMSIPHKDIEPWTFNLIHVILSDVIYVLIIKQMDLIFKLF